MRLMGTGAGGEGGDSRRTSGSGVAGLGGCWRMMRGGAGGALTAAASVMTRAPGCGGVGGRK